MALWTDVIDPATLTGYARLSLANYEARKGSLARYLPNREVADVVVRFVKGSSGLVDAAAFRAYDAEPEVGKRPAGSRVTLELPALGQNIPVSEYEQLRLRNATDDSILPALLRTTDIAVQAVADAIERLRGIVLSTGKATIGQANFSTDDDFGRNGGNTVVAGTLWATPAVDRLSDLNAWVDTYRDRNGEDPGSMLMSTRVFRALASGNQFQTQLINGGARPATEADVQAIVAGAGLPPIIRYDRRVSVGGTGVKVIPDNKLLLLPAPVETDDFGGTQLGATYWGQTLTASEPDWELSSSDQPGIVTGVYKNEKPPVIAQVIADAIALPVLANADLSFSATVLS